MSLRVKPLVRSSEGFRIAERASRAFLNARIRQSYVKEEKLRKENEEIVKVLEESLDDPDLTLVTDLCKGNMKRMHESTKQQHIRKLESLIEKKRKTDSKSVSLRPQGLKKWVVYLTNKSLSRDQELMRVEM